MNARFQLTTPGGDRFPERDALCEAFEDLHDWARNRGVQINVRFGRPDLLEAVRTHIRAGLKIEAIKAYRQAIPCDLCTAKDAVERMIEEERGG